MDTDEEFLFICNQEFFICNQDCPVRILTFHREATKQTHSHIHRHISMSDADGEKKQEEVEAEVPPGTTEEEEPAFEGERRFSLQQIFSIFYFAPSFFFFYFSFTPLET